MRALGLVDGWQAPEAAVGVVGAESRVLAQRGHRARRSRWASVTKLVTALGALVAFEEGALDLDAAAGPPGATVRHLLAHASGLAFDDARTVAEPGRRRIYSNTGFEVLGAAMAEQVGMPFEQYLHEAVLEPLGMEGARLDGTPAAGIVGSLEDLLRLAAELLAPTLLAPATLRLATTVAFPGLAGVLPGFGFHDPQDWGLGFELRDQKRPHWMGPRCSAGSFGHFGASGSFLWVDGEAGLACAVLSGRPFGAWAARAWPAFSDAVVDEFGAG
ncbi:MAG: beta-lactamase family protein [Actinobacteria bacterium]|nr:beta-lactamase family protein [Actinomycetota bacterium]